MCAKYVGSLEAQLVNWRHTVERKWAGFRFGQLKIETSGGKHAFEVHVFLVELDPDAVRVELYAEGAFG